MVTQSVETKVGNAAFEGYAIDLISEIAEILSKYKLRKFANSKAKKSWYIWELTCIRMLSKIQLIEIVEIRRKTLKKVSQKDGVSIFSVR